MTKLFQYNFRSGQNCDLPKARKAEHFDFDLTCDVTGDPEVIIFSLTLFPGL